jgi:hypothetical protein
MYAMKGGTSRVLRTAQLLLRMLSAAGALAACMTDCRSPPHLVPDAQRP